MSEADADAAFILTLQNDPSWLRYIGDRGLRTLDDAASYIRTGPVDMYARLKLGFCIVEIRSLGIPVGICGLTQRTFLADPDIGFALLPEYCGHGYALEAARAVLQDAEHRLRLGRVVATTRPDNVRSASLLKKLGLTFRTKFLHPDGDRHLDLYQVDFA